MLFFVSAVGRCDNASRLLLYSLTLLTLSVTLLTFIVNVNAPYYEGNFQKRSETALFRTKKVRMITCTTRTPKVRQIARKQARIGFIPCVADRTCKGEAV